jgi:hypothetical protein
MDKEGNLKCLFCGEILPINRIKYKILVCNNECRKNYTKVIEAEEKERFYMTKVIKDNGRRCLVCGENCYPNYYYCNRHHTGKDDTYDF